MFGWFCCGTMEIKPNNGTDWDWFPICIQRLWSNTSRKTPRNIKHVDNPFYILVRVSTSSTSFWVTSLLVSCSVDCDNASGISLKVGTPKWLFRSKITYCVLSWRDRFYPYSSVMREHVCGCRSASDATLTDMGKCMWIQQELIT